MTDREYLELAAKAAGISSDRLRDLYDQWDKDCAPVLVGRAWSPLADDGDALRLAVKLRKIPVIERWSDGHDWVFIPGHEGGALPLGNDPLAATRRAIVCAAAELGKNL